MCRAAAVPRVGLAWAAATDQDRTEEVLGHEESQLAVPRCSRELRLQTVPPPPAQQQTVRAHNPTPTLIPLPPQSFSVWYLRIKDCLTPPGSHRRHQEAREVRKQLSGAWFAHGSRMGLVPGGHHGWPAVHLGGGRATPPLLRFMIVGAASAHGCSIAFRVSWQGGLGGKTQLF